jgi:hypothetical protein
MLRDHPCTGWNSQLMAASKTKKIKKQAGKEILRYAPPDIHISPKFVNGG